MEALVGLILVIVLLIAAFYALGILIVVIGAAGWYLSFPVLAALSVLLAVWPPLCYRRLTKRKQWAGSFWLEEGDKIVGVGIVLLIVWGCALRDQISALWDSVSPYVLR